MKILELDLKKKVLIVEIPRLADYEFINKECKYLKIGNEEVKLNASTLDKFEFLCKGSELTEEIASELVEKHCMCFVCGGDGKETCTNPDHGFISMLSFHDVGRLGCPCCGHDPNHKIKNGGNCECCNGLGKLTETQFNQQAYEYGFDDDIDFNLSKESFISAVESEGFHWLENPIKHPKDYEVFPDSLSLYAEQERLHLEAEEKTFRNPLIFVKK